MLQPAGWGPSCCQRGPPATKPCIFWLKVWAGAAPHPAWEQLAPLLSTVRVAGPWADLTKHSCVPWRRQLSCTYFANKITALAQGQRRQSWEEGRQGSTVQPQHFTEDKQPRVCHAQPTPAPRCSPGAAPVPGRVFLGVMLALEALAGLWREIRVGGIDCHQ